MARIRARPIAVMQEHARQGGTGTSTGTLPPPPIAMDVDLRDYRFMPLDVVSERDSAVVDEVSGEEYRGNLLLRCAAWHQVPAGSLPDDERQLAKLAGYGRAVDAWQAVQVGALHGFAKASDGRLYHAIVVEKAIDAWAGKRKASAKGRAGAMKRWGQSTDHTDASETSLLHETDEGAGIACAIATSNSAGNGTGNAPATKNHSNGEDRIGRGEERKSKDARARGAAHPRRLSDQHLALLLHATSDFNEGEVKAWLLPCEFVLQDGALAVSAPSEWFCAQIQERFALRLKKVFGANEIGVAVVTGATAP